jgi:hypothetical protein
MVEEAAVTPETGLLVVSGLRTVRVKQLGTYNEYLVYNYDEITDVVLLNDITTLDLDEERTALSDIALLAKIAGISALVLRLLDGLRKFMFS